MERRRRWLKEKTKTRKWRKKATVKNDDRKIEMENKERRRNKRK